MKVKEISTRELELLRKIFVVGEPSGSSLNIRTRPEFHAAALSCESKGLIHIRVNGIGNWARLTPTGLTTLIMSEQHRKNHR